MFSNKLASSLASATAISFTSSLKSASASMCSFLTINSSSSSLILIASSSSALLSSRLRLRSPSSNACFSSSSFAFLAIIADNLAFFFCNSRSLRRFSNRGSASRNSRRRFMAACLSPSAKQTFGSSLTRKDFATISIPGTSGWNLDNSHWEKLCSWASMLSSFPLIRNLSIWKPTK